MEQGKQGWAYLRVAYRRRSGESALKRLAQEGGVAVDVIRGRLTPRHVRLEVFLRGRSDRLVEAIRSFAGRRVAVRWLRCAWGMPAPAGVPLQLPRMGSTRRPGPPWPIVPATGR